MNEVIVIDENIDRLRKEYRAHDMKDLIFRMDQRIQILAGPLVQCEASDPDCGPAEHYDSEGVPLCRGCWEQLLADSASESGDEP